MNTASPTSSLFSLPSHGRWRSSDVAPFITAWRASGLSLAKFCRLHGVDAMRVRHHVRCAAQNDGPDFIEMRPLTSTSTLMLAFPNGVTIAVRSTTDLSLVRAVMDALV
jgi:hypothetical protein